MTYMNGVNFICLIRETVSDQYVVDDYWTRVLCL